MMSSSVGSIGSDVIEVSSAGASRTVRLIKRQKGSYVENREFQTHWPEELLYKLAGLKGEWFFDSYQRFEHPNYIQKQIDGVLELYRLDIRHSSILDFGCGFGASSYCLIKRGAFRIKAADLRQENIDFAREFFSAMGMADKIDLECGDIVPTLERESFDIIWLQAVMEHLMPEERRSYLPRFWQALRRGGMLIVTETPNRVWPRERHTTGGTWWIPWMKPEKVFAKMRNDSRYQTYSVEDFYRCGIIGSSYDEILDCLGRPPNCEQMSLQLRGYLKYLYANATQKRLSRRMGVQVCSLAEPLTRSLLGKPVTAFMPFLNHLVFKKI